MSRGHKPRVTIGNANNRGAGDADESCNILCIDANGGQNAGNRWVRGLTNTAAALQ